MREARSEPRDLCEIEATIVADEVSVPCLIEDLSENGAKLVLHDERELPPVFELMLPIFDDLYETRTVECRWRVGRIFGVRFVGEAASQ